MSENNLNLELRNGAIILTVNDAYAILTPEQAKAIGEQMCKYAYEAETGLEPKTKSIIADNLRNKLTTRTSLVIKNLHDKKKQPLYIAQSVVDIILSEVL